ncbi:MAG: hypothetical protein Kow0089_08930 [Desulfobulbaceae bacterium]
MLQQNQNSIMTAPRTTYTLIFLVLLLVAETIHGDVVDRVVAIVNDDVITLSEVNEEGAALFKRVAATVPASEREEALKQVRQTIIDKLIDRKILLQAAAKENITVSDEEIDRAFEKILQINKIRPEQLRQKLAEMGMDESSYRKNLRIQVLSSKLVSREIRSKVIIPEERIIDYYDTHYTRRVSEGGYYLLQIGISFPQGNDGEQAAAREEARKKVEQIRERAVAGEDFRELARKFSDLPSAVDGGDIGVLKEQDMSPAMREVVRKTGTGEISPIIETPSGYQFFKILSSQEGQIVTQVPYEAVKEEIYETLYEQEMQSRYSRWLQEMKRKAYIKIL